MKLEHNTWYWMYDPREGDIFYPVYIIDDTLCMLDGFHTEIDELGDIAFVEAIMPDDLK